MQSNLFMGKKAKSFSVWDIGPHEANYVTSENIKAEQI